MCCNVDVYSIFLYPVAPYDVNITGDTTITHGSRLQLRCMSEGGPRFKFSWSRIGRTLYTTSYTSLNYNDLSISNINTHDRGNYTCTVTNDAGSSSNTVTVYGELGYVI